MTPDLFLRIACPSLKSSQLGPGIESAAGKPRHLQQARLQSHADVSQHPALVMLQMQRFCWFSVPVSLSGLSHTNQRTYMAMLILSAPSSSHSWVLSILACNKAIELWSPICCVSALQCMWPGSHKARICAFGCMLALHHDPGRPLILVLSAPLRCRYCRICDQHSL